MIDQGRESREVLQRIIALRDLCSVVLIQGNHEEMLYAARDDEKALRYWENCGGVNTLNSYRFGGTLADIPAEHWALLDTTRAQPLRPLGLLARTLITRTSPSRDRAVRLDAPHRRT